MQRSPQLYLEDILQAIEYIELYTRKITFEHFGENKMMFDAVVLRLQIIGEATKHLPVEIRSLCPGIEWKKIAGFRDVLSHAYFSVDARIVWDVIQNKLPLLKKNVKSLLLK